jgi:hypothetical protein
MSDLSEHNADSNMSDLFQHNADSDRYLTVI